MNSDWFTALFAPVVIGRSNYFDIGFSTVIEKSLFKHILKQYFPSVPYHATCDLQFLRRRLWMHRAYQKRINCV